MFFYYLFPGYSTPHDRNENSSPGQTGQHSPANLSYMPMAIQRHSGAAQSIGYHIPNMKEEPNTGANNYPNMTQQDDMSVRVRFTNIRITLKDNLGINIFFNVYLELRFATSRSL